MPCLFVCLFVLQRYKTRTLVGSTILFKKMYKSQFGVTPVIVLLFLQFLFAFCVIAVVKKFITPLNNFLYTSSVYYFS